MQQLVTKFGSLKIDSGGDAVINSDAKMLSCNLQWIDQSVIRLQYHQKTSLCLPCYQFWVNQILSPLLQKPILLDINFNHVSYPLWQGCDHHKVRQQRLGSWCRWWQNLVVSKLMLREMQQWVLMQSQRCLNEATGRIKWQDPNVHENCWCRQFWNDEKIKWPCRKKKIWIN